MSGERVSAERMLELGEAMGSLRWAYQDVISDSVDADLLAATAALRQAASDLRERDEPDADELRAVIVRGCETLGRFGLKPTTEATAALGSIIASASWLGRQVDREPRFTAAEVRERRRSAITTPEIEALTDALTPHEWFVLVKAILDALDNLDRALSPKEAPHA